MRYRAFSLLILVVIAVLARNWFLSDSDSNDDQLVISGKVAGKTIQVNSVNGLKAKPVDPEMALRVYKSIHDDSQTGKLNLTDIQDKIDQWMNKAAENVNSLLYSDENYEIENVNLSETSSQSGFYSVYADKDVFLVRDKNNESILFVAKLKDSSSWSE